MHFIDLFRELQFMIICNSAADCYYWQKEFLSGLQLLESVESVKGLIISIHFWVFANVS